MLLTHVVNPSQPTLAEIQQMYEELATQFNEHIDVLCEALTPVEGDLDEQLAELSKRFDAAKRGLSIAHKLPAGAAKKKHMSAILTNMNIIRGMLQQVNKRLVQEITQFSTAEHDYEQGLGYEEQEEEVPQDQVAQGSTTSPEYRQAIAAIKNVMMARGHNPASG